MPDPITEKIIGAAIEVHKALGPGLLESIYEEALCHEFRLQGINFSRQVPVRLSYKGCEISGHRLDLLVENEVIVELKSLQQLPPIAVSQLISYLRAANLKRGLIINFGANKLINGIKRVSI